MGGLARSTHGEGMVSDGLDLMLTERSTTKTCGVVHIGTGVTLEYAKSINDLLKVLYDVLEVHRALMRERSIHYCDTSLYNILVYREWPSRPDVGAPGYYPEHPALVGEVLEGNATDSGRKMAHCVLIDMDNGKMLDDDCAGANRDNSALRTGTPMYIARAVAAGRVPRDPWVSIKFWKMPFLSGEARALYVAAHGEERYDRYNDGEGTHHGGVRLSTDISHEDLDDLAKSVTFYHRWEYDAESVFWTLYSVLVRVIPQGAQFSTGAQRVLSDMWETLSRHTIEDSNKSDSRTPLLLFNGIDSFLEVFALEMHDVARMLVKMALQVAPSYALMTPLPPHDDHLHEAMQRLILDYLVAHLDNPIPLTGELRETGQPTQQVAAVNNYRPPEEKKSTVTSSKRRRAEEESAQVQTSLTGSQRESQNRPSVQLRRSSRQLSKNEPLAMVPPPLPALFAAPPDRDGPAEADEAPAPKRCR
ncbi:hypothetical protein BD413DRAFT_612307 [Trametes elegans]|nr:hypothetical protein BD413DRAFT_612307 [Trametes elegans]